MENIKLIIDSSSNMKSDPDHNVEVVPLTISFGGKDYIDDQNLNIREFLNDMNQNQVAGKTTCPSIQAWLNALEGTEKAIIITMTSGMSGTFSSALQAKTMYEEKHPTSQIIVVDSRSAGPELTIVLHRIEKMIQGDIRFVDLEEVIAKFRMRTHLLFILQSLHNLSLNGRVSPAAAKVAGLLKINLIGTASKEGKLEPLTKARGMKKAMRELLKYMKDDNYHGGEVIIDHCENEKDAEIIKDKILAEYPDAQVTIRPMRGLCSFYAEEGGIMVGFHE
ncbi:DegV family protein [Lactobacillus amylovorus]|jgi:DegV family protein with EDD domain|uniref:DegV family protein n=1 Tax=Lactobacillus amylovorus TaxID=1604 RepID=A0AAW6B4J1_LACAM|nr:DegV family protein [Lactobacillus amylovorus]MCH4140066.1 DegV family protein [Lactobacillus amylovorus]MCT3585308.1 DegV family protein [Lactobacillus amylovorus]MDA6088686.1 DegV family protein [Lactobacillus amylovorus]MDB6239766.1 DegV family protein [Lactobacillus amylovorus]MDB6245765.1 DegV family protein [Lactobacillus amylovorus]